MADLVVELPDGDITPLLAHLAEARFVNLRPGVDAPEEGPSGPLGNLFGSRGPTVPLATWTPGEIGLQHGLGQRAVGFLADRHVAIPDEWYIATDHPKRGLVVRTYQTPVEEVLRWLVRAVTATCPLPITEPWRAVIRLP